MSKIKIYARIRSHPEQYWRNRPYNITLREKHIQLTNEKIDLYNKKIIERQNFMFDKVFDIDYSNDDIYNEIGNSLIDNLINKQNSVFYVYGQTGSGKSYTLLGNDNKMGIIEMLLLGLGASGIDFKYSGVQIYKNRCYDIFSNIMLKECERYDGSVDFLNIQEKEINIEKLRSIGGDEKIISTIGNIISNLKESRHIGISSANKVSSRSHLILQIKKGDNYIKIVDLAGSERAKRGIQNLENNFKENADINLGILAIKECIRNINKKKIPYRNSKITKILKETFSNKVCTYIMSTISPLRRDAIDSKDSLKQISEFKKNKDKNIKQLPPLNIRNKEIINKLNNDINNELKKSKLEKSKLLNLIEDNIKSLKDLKSNIINI